MLSAQPDCLKYDLFCTDKAQTVILEVESMKCGGCSASVKRILMAKEGVASAAVNLLTESAVVKLTGRQGTATLEDLTQTLTAKVPMLPHEE